MRPEVNAIAGRLSLRPPQRRALEILDRITEIAPPDQEMDITSALEATRSEFPSVTDFERDFPSVCFALATGVGKTRLMGAFIAYLHQAHGIDNFFVLAPNLTIYNKLIADFTPGTPKYVFKGIAQFATTQPEIITGDNYESRGTLLTQLVSCKINIFNISKINSEVRGGRSPRIKRLSEYIGQSYFEYLASLPDLVLLMDESHRYRASAGVKAINELKPVIGLELTATPQVETSRGAVRFANVVYDYPLGKAMADGFVKEPAVVTRKDLDPSKMSQAALEDLKLRDGIQMHERTKVALETYAREYGRLIVKPFMLVIARDTTHAAQLVEVIQGEKFFDGRYREKVIQVDSSKSGAEEEKMIERLLEVERSDSPTEVVVHVNMLKEGWDVTNLYTIVPLRAANAKTLIEQSIGRGLRLPYGQKTGVEDVDRLNIIAHDKFQELVDEARKPDSIVQLKQVVLDDEELRAAPRRVVVTSRLDDAFGIRPEAGETAMVMEGERPKPVFDAPELPAAKVIRDVIRDFERRPDLVPTASALETPDVRAAVLEEVRARYVVDQLGLDGMVEEVDLAAIVTKAMSAVAGTMISIPRIIVQPKGEVHAGFDPFTLELASWTPDPGSEDLWLQYLRSGEGQALTAMQGQLREERLEDYVVAGLLDYDDVAYDQQSDLLYDLARQVARHLRTYLDEEKTERVLRMQQRQVAQFVHAQMQDHYWEHADSYEVTVRAGFTEIKTPELTTTQPIRDFRSAPPDRGNIARYVFGGFQRCLHDGAKFQSDTERVLSIILDRESEKWFRPAHGQFQMYYSLGGRTLEYQPDFVAETAEAVYMLEPKRSSDMDDPDVVAKKDAAVLWCQRASDHAAKHGGKPWLYVLIPDNEVAENVSLEGLVRRFTRTAQESA